jgi:hypothetical protein
LDIVISERSTRKIPKRTRRGKSIVEQRRKNAYDSITKWKNTYDVMRGENPNK